MWRIVHCTLLWVILQGSAIACRTDMPTHQLRMENAEIAFVAIISGVSVPDLERFEYEDKKGRPIIYGMPLTVRLVSTIPLKGVVPKLLEISLSRCDGSVIAQIGRDVNVYKINGRWRIDEPELVKD